MTQTPHPDAAGFFLATGLVATDLPGQLRLFAGSGVSTIVAIDGYYMIDELLRLPNLLSEANETLTREHQSLEIVDGDRAELLTIPRETAPYLGLIHHRSWGDRILLPGGANVGVFSGPRRTDQPAPFTVVREPEEFDVTKDEPLTGEEIRSIISSHVEIMVTSTAPLDVLNHSGLSVGADKWVPGQVAPSEARSKAHKEVFQHVRPRVLIGGPHTHLVDEVVGYYSIGGFPTHVIMLPPPAVPTDPHIAIAHPQSGRVDIFDNNRKRIEQYPPQVTRLTMSMSGQYVIQTLGSWHLMDLDRRVVARHPGPGAVAYATDRPATLRSIEQCGIGEIGFWTMEDDNRLIEFSWHQSSVVRHIIPVAEWPPVIPPRVDRSS